MNKTVESLALLIMAAVIVGVTSKVASPSIPVKPNTEHLNQLKETLYSGYADCKTELDLPGANFSEFRREIVADAVDDHKVGCALTCIASKANYVIDNQIDKEKLKDDVDKAFTNDHPLIIEFKTTVNKCVLKSNIQHSEDKCNLIKGLFGCILNEYKNGTVARLITTLASTNRQILFRKFTVV